MKKLTRLTPKQQEKGIAKVRRLFPNYMNENFGRLNRNIQDWKDPKESKKGKICNQRGAFGRVDRFGGLKYDKTNSNF